MDKEGWAEFQEGFDHWKRRLPKKQFGRKVIIEMFRNLFKSYRYLQEYNAYILNDGMSEEEFKKVAEKYASPFKKKPPEEIIRVWLWLTEITGDSLSVMDLSQLIDVDPKDVEEAVIEFKKGKERYES